MALCYYVDRSSWPSGEQLQRFVRFHTSDGGWIPSESYSIQDTTRQASEGSRASIVHANPEESIADFLLSIGDLLPAIRSDLIAPIPGDLRLDDRSPIRRG